jgi:hypothetical protein
MTQKRKQQNFSWGAGSAIFLTALVGIFVLIGTPAIVQGILHLLPTTEVPVSSAGRSSVFCCGNSPAKKLSPGPSSSSACCSPPPPGPGGPSPRSAIPSRAPASPHYAALLKRIK